MSQSGVQVPRFDAEMDRHYQAALARSCSDPSVVGVDVGFVYDRHGTMTGAIDVRVHRRASGVASPIATISSPRQPVPRSAMNRDHSSAVRPGARIANLDYTVGTFGLVVYDARTNERLIMSSAHVLGTPQGSRDELVHLVPGGTERPRALARCLRAVNSVMGDAAVAEPLAEVEIDIAQRNGTIITRAAFPQLGDIVEKIGAATGRTRGVVDGLGRYFLSGDSDGMLGFRIVRGVPNGTRDVAQPGDSGAAWYRLEDHVGVGLHVGGDQSIEDESLQPAIACYLPVVLDALAVTPVPNDQRR
jgi:hypothetical protein